MFWSLTLPEDLYAGEPAHHAAARNRLAAAITDAALTDNDPCLAMHQVTRTSFGNSPKWAKRLNHEATGWFTESCGNSVPNTHWHILRCSNPLADQRADADRAQSLWLAWRVHKVAGQPSPDGGCWTVRDGTWRDLDTQARRKHLVISTMTSPIADTLAGLIDELTHQAQGQTRLGATKKNDYHFTEIAGVELALGVRHPDGVPVRMLETLGGFPKARAMDINPDLPLGATPGTRFPYRWGLGRKKMTLADA